MSHNAKNALVIGGSNGLGYAVVQKLLQENYKKIIILDKVKPEADNPKIKYFYISCAGVAQ